MRSNSRGATTRGMCWPSRPRVVDPRLGRAKLCFFGYGRLSAFCSVSRCDNVAPKGAAVLPALGNAQGNGGSVRRAIGPTGQPFARGEENGWPVGPARFSVRTLYQGVALAWENYRAFGPSVAASLGAKPAEKSDSVAVAICQILRSPLPGYWTLSILLSITDPFRMNCLANPRQSDIPQKRRK